jgi:hypothetical protein
MLVKNKRAERTPKWSRHGRGVHSGERVAVASAGAASPRERRHGGPSEDRALYTCECGYAFEALVTTSVGCPHCARTQAW